MSVVGFRGGKRCLECDEQIDPKRLRAKPDAQLCIECERARDDARLRAVTTVNQCARGSITV